MEQVVVGLISKAVPRVEVVDTRDTTVGSLGVFEARVRFDYPAPGGATLRGTGRLYLPVRSIETLLEGGALAPLVFASGYEQGPDELSQYLSLGAVGASTVAEEAPDARYNPLARGINLDVAMLHIARSLPFVDLGRVLVTGGSAGGYMGLMLSAETFPLSGALLTSPIVHVPYNLSYWRTNAEMVAATPGRFPILAAVMPIVQGAEVLYGRDFDASDYLACSPHSHLNLVTGRVLVVHSTADVLVPVDQIDKETAIAGDRTGMPAGFVMSPTELDVGEITTLSSARPGAVEHLSLPNDAPEYPRRFPYGPMPQAVPGPQLSLPDSGMRLLVLEEGGPVPFVGHFRYVAECGWPIAEAVSASAGSAGELTAAKLAALMKRAAGREWVGGDLRSLDFPEAERADVLAGLRWWSQLPERRSNLEQLYSQLPEDLQVFGRLLDLR